MKTRHLFLSILTIFMITFLAACGGSDTKDEEESTDDKVIADNGEVNLYTGRHYDTDDELYKRFTEQTGIKVNVISGDNDELVARLEREGEASEADLFMTADAGRLHLAKTKDLLQPVDSEVLNENIPDKYRDDDNMWFGLTKRARVIAYHKDRVDPETIQTYEDLIADENKGKVLIRSSDNVYNQSLMASFIVLNGEDEAMDWAQGIVDNMARNPKGGDTDQAIALAAGEGDVAVINTYYLGRMLHSEEDELVKAAEQIDIVFPNQDTTGTHVNISGISLTASSKNKDNAIKLMEFLTTEEAQGLFSSTNFEYPVNPDVEASELLQEWGEFKEQEIDLTELGNNNEQATKIMMEVGWK